MEVQRLRLVLAGAGWCCCCCYALAGNSFSTSAHDASSTSQGRSQPYAVIIWTLPYPFSRTCGRGLLPTSPAVQRPWRHLVRVQEPNGQSWSRRAHFSPITLLDLVAILVDMPCDHVGDLIPGLLVHSNQQHPQSPHLLATLVPFKITI